ncbi:hypothetical protein SNE40_021991 [Patella caerulea]|uniref:E3 ubiquitin-protein ligase n=1 Tax=Patella caerulea TaxID=87958 RepID=A0AAN8J4E6_PATCE
MASSSVSLHYKLKNGVVAFVEWGDIFSVPADVLVYSSGQSKKEKSGIAHQMLRKGGESYRQALDILHETHSILEEGQVYELPPGDLYKKFDSIYLAITTMYNFFKPWSKKLQELYSNILSKADRNRKKSITLPVLGSGFAAAPIDKCIEAVIKSIEKLEPRYLVHINIVSNDYDTFQKISKELKSRVPNDTRTKTSFSSSNYGFKKSTGYDYSSTNTDVSLSRKQNRSADAAVSLNRDDGKLRDIEKYHRKADYKTYNGGGNFRGSDDEAGLNKNYGKDYSISNCRSDDDRGNEHYTSKYRYLKEVPGFNIIHDNDSRNAEESRAYDLERKEPVSYFVDHHGNQRNMSDTNGFYPHHHSPDNYNSKDWERRFGQKQFDNGGGYEKDSSKYRSKDEEHRFGQKQFDNGGDYEYDSNKSSFRSKKTMSSSEQEFGSESGSDHRQMLGRDDHQIKENSYHDNRLNKPKSSCGHCKKVFNGPNCTQTCGHRLCCDCGGSKDPCPFFQEDGDAKEDSTSPKPKTCDHRKNVFTAPDYTMRCGHIVCSKCPASKYPCLYSRDKDPEVDQYLQKISSKGDSDDSEDTHIKEEEDSVETCAICMEVPLIPKHLTKCGHVFCTKCIETCFKLYKPVCPTCGTTYGILTGDQPPGVMQITKFYRGVDGEERAGCYQINYTFTSGVQDENHPNPGTRYLPTRRTAYLPATTEGTKVCKMLIVAFKRKLIFTVGKSTTTGQENRITWNDIHHKTSMSGGPTHFGYPDPTYLNRVKEELASKGITEDDIRDVRLRDDEIITS